MSSTIKLSEVERAELLIQSFAWAVMGRLMPTCGSM